MYGGPYGREFSRGYGRRGPPGRYGRRPPRRWEGGPRPFDGRPRAPPRGRRYWEQQQQQQWMWQQQTGAPGTSVVTMVVITLGVLVAIGVVVGVTVALTSGDNNDNTATTITTTTEGPITCDQTPPSIANGNVVVTGNTATYSCNTCHGLLGSETRTCQNGLWGGSPPRCLACGCPGVVPNLSIGARKKRQTLDRIIGGGDAIENSWPWQVGLKAPGYTFSCGGSLLSESWIVTAAHCFFDGGVRQYSTSRAVLGEHDQRATGAREREVSFNSRTDVFLHPSYSPTGSNDNDIALIRIQPTTLRQDGIWPVCLPTTLSFTQGEDSWSTGWGATDPSTAASLSDILKQVKTNIITYDRCNADTGYNGLTSNMICAGVPGGGKDTCQGDSGGPLVVKRSGTWYLAGVTSFGGETCADPNFPGVYARVSQLQLWLQTTMASN